VGVRVIRRPDGGFTLSGNGPLTLPRDTSGRIDVAAATQMINDVVEGWVREHPGQWLWFHRRWRWVSRDQAATKVAQIRLLDRSLDGGQEGVPSRSLEAIDPSTANDRMTGLRYIALASQMIGGALDWYTLCDFRLNRDTNLI
jgi:hypothetical protein